MSAVLVAAFFQSFAGAPPAAPTEGPSPSSQAVRPRLAVLDFRVEGKVDATGSSLVAAVVREEFNRSGRFDLMDREMMRERMTEKDFAASDECDQVRCLVKFGKTLDVQQIVGGQVASFGQTWVLTMRLVDVNTGREEKTVTRRHDGAMEDLLDVAREAAAGMLGKEPVASPPRPRGGAPATKTLTIDCGNGVTMELVLIPAGTFTMGSPQSEQMREDDEAQHQVTISRPFYMGKHEVTVGQFRRFVEETTFQSDAEKGGQSWEGGKKGGYALKSDGNLGWVEAANWRNPGFAQTDSHPVVLVSWNDAKAFCDWLSRKHAGRAVRLPSEAEWEYACRGGKQTKYWWGDAEDTTGTVANLADQALKRKYPNWSIMEMDDGYVYTAPVGSYRANEFELHDMTGNVWEWCADWYGAYGSAAQSDPKGPASGDIRVLRGGSWYGRPWYCRSAFRGRDTPGSRYDDDGFRVVVDSSGTP
ncbi:MAG: SUMF1/EgtB/PvdO family nonheme iron enzyme [Phycisphaerae bacterium]|nr:SUMF1/EgtB/PvdO family nonheme iron enzyme [Phycisphaerae bacterium]NUQ46413.1 SUMF1/EgtB/PvdO family nonheme iron enzyme [Phycisphaerae bacterium]